MAPLSTQKRPTLAVVDRVLPNSLESEMAVLGAMMYSQESADKVMDRVADAESFYYAAHRTIFTEACALMEAFRAVDIVLLTQRLRDKNMLEEVGGASYLSDLMVNVPVTAMVDQYIDVVLNKQMLRNLIQSAHLAISRSFEEQDIPQEIIEQAAQAVQALAEGNVQGGFVPVPELVADTVRLIEQLMSSHSALTGISTGFRDIDRLTGGLHRQEMIVIAARPSMGKSALAMNIAEHVAIDLDKPVGVFSLEMSKEELMKRLISARAKIDLRKLSAGFGGKDVDMSRLTAVASELIRSKLFIDDSPALSITQIKARAHRLKKNHDIELLIIDYMQLMKCPGKQSDSNRQVEVALISQGVKALAKELNIPVIVLCQLNRKPDEREGGRPKLSDLRECVTGDTFVSLADGGRVPISSLVNQSANVLAIRDGKIVSDWCDKVWHVGCKDVFRVELTSGRAIKATGEHRLYGFNEWRTVSSLSVGDRIATVRIIPEPKSPIKMSSDELLFLAHMIGDGSYLMRQPIRYTTGSEYNSREVFESAKRLFPSCKINRRQGTGNWHQLEISDHGNKWNRGRVRDWFSSLGIYNQRSSQKHIPSFVWRLSNADVALFLRSLWSTDGTIGVGARGQTLIAFDSCSRALIEGVQSLLLRFSVVARIRKTFGPKGTSWLHLVVDGRENQIRFLTLVGASEERKEESIKALAALSTTTSGTNVDTIPVECFDVVRSEMKSRGITTRQMAKMRGKAYGGMSQFRFSPSRKTVANYGDVLGSEVLKKYSQSDLFWDSVKSITPEGRQEVFDLTVAGSGCWLANDIVSHNSGQIEQDADIVALLIRPEVNEGNEDKREALRGQAQLIIAKQRNGPTGDIPLTFLREYTRFVDVARVDDGDVPPEANESY